MEVSDFTKLIWNNDDDSGLVEYFIMNVSIGDDEKEGWISTRQATLILFRISLRIGAC